MGTGILFIIIGIIVGVLGCIGLNKLEKRFDKNDGFPDSRGRK